VSGPARSAPPSGAAVPLALAAILAAAAPAGAADGWASARVVTRLVLLPEVSLADEGTTIRLAAPWVSMVEADAGRPAEGWALRVRGYLMTDVRAPGAAGAEGFGAGSGGGTGSGAALAIATLDWQAPGSPLAATLGRQLLALGTGRLERGDGLRLTFRVAPALKLTAFVGAAAPPAWVGPGPFVTDVDPRAAHPLLLMARADLRPLRALALGIALSHLAGERTWLGVDTALALGPAAVLARAAYDPDARDLASAAASVSAAVGRLNFAAGVQRVRPDLLLPRDSLLRAFAGPPRDEAFASALAALGVLRVGADASAILFEDGPGMDARVRARLTLAGGLRPAVDADVGWLATPSGGYLVARLGLRAGNALASASLDGTFYLRDAPPAHGGSPFTGAVRLAALWRATPWLRVGADGGWASTPWLVYGLSAGMTLEGSYDVVR
jgi:hypothetical protein